MVYEAYKVFNILRAIYSLIKEIYLWQKHDNENKEKVNHRGLAVFMMYATLLIFSLSLNFLLLTKLVKVTQYLDAYVKATYESMEYVKNHSNILPQSPICVNTCDTNFKKHKQH